MLLNTGLPVSEQDQGDYGEQILGLVSDLLVVLLVRLL